MKSVYRVLLALMLAGSVVTVTPSRADWGPVTVTNGGAVLKPPHKHIRMEVQDITIRLQKTSYRVDGVFRFYNTGETTTEWVGFPQRGDVPDFSRFDTWVNGLKAKVWKEPHWFLRFVLNVIRSFVRHSSDDRWMVQHVTFPGHRVTTIRVRYKAPYLKNKRVGRSVIYEHWTGGYWKDKIGLAAITIDAKDIGGAKNLRLPSTWGWQKLVTENAVRLAATDFKPNRREVLRVYLAH